MQEGVVSSFSIGGLSSSICLTIAGQARKKQVANREIIGLMGI